jgi:hypothetical protein
LTGEDAAADAAATQFLQTTAASITHKNNQKTKTSPKSPNRPRKRHKLEAHREQHMLHFSNGFLSEKKTVRPLTLRIFFKQYHLPFELRL